MPPFLPPLHDGSDMSSIFQTLVSWYRFLHNRRFYTHKIVGSKTLRYVTLSCVISVTQVFRRQKGSQTFTELSGISFTDSLMK